MTLTPDELNRYQRHLSLPDFDMAAQQQLKNAKILCIGAGGIGSPLLLYLASAGIGHIGIIDDDKVELSNLQRQILFSEQHIGQPKAIVASEVIKAHNSTIQVTPYHERFSYNNGPLLVNAYDFIIDGSDNFATRYLANDLCVAADKPLISAMVFQHQAMVARFNIAGQGCYRCLFPEAPPKDQLPNCNMSGVMGPTVGIIGTLAANLAIHTIIQSQLPMNLLTRINTQTLKWESFHYQKNANCNCQQEIKTVATPPLETEPDNDITMISAQQLKAMMASDEKFLLIDVREDWERTAMSIDNSHHVPLATINDWQSDDQQIPIVLFCHTDVRSYQAAVNLNHRGYPHVMVLKHGISGFLK